MRHPAAPGTIPDVGQQYGGLHPEYSPAVHSADTHTSCSLSRRTVGSRHPGRCLFLQ